MPPLRWTMGSLVGGGQDDGGVVGPEQEWRQSQIASEFQHSNTLTMPDDCGLAVTLRMREILAQPGFLSSDGGGQELRELYSNGNKCLSFTTRREFDEKCAVQTGTAPPLNGTETPYEFSYATLIVSGAQRVSGNGGNPDALKHDQVLEYLIAHGMPVDIPDVVGQTALYHSIVSPEARVDLARILIVSGKANVNHQSKYGEVALLGVFQLNRVEAADLLMEHGADIDIADADGLTAREYYLKVGPDIMACVGKWIRRREGTEGEVGGETVACVCGKQKDLSVCGKCKVLKYCSSECQQSDWGSHKRICVPFSPSNTVIVKPFYNSPHMTVYSTTTKSRQIFGLPTGPQNPKHLRASHVPKLSKGREGKDMIIRIQLPGGSDNTDMLVYDRKREFVCAVRREDGEAVYDRMSAVIRAQGAGGKAYFAATLKKEEELIVKIGDVLAGQPF
ncbi:hypothetical protein EYR36_010631 [Pleurotus pulmonarius]|nr:hypothetical protein EYR36_010631 [Pleurotus pulmonarius]